MIINAGDPGADKLVIRAFSNGFPVDLVVSDACPKGEVYRVSTEPRLPLLPGNCGPFHGTVRIINIAQNARP